MQTTLFGIVSIILGWLCFAHVHGCSRWQHECTSVTHTRSSALPERHPDCALVLSAWHDSDLHRSHRNPIDPGSAQHAALTDSSAHVRITSAMVKALIPCTSYSRDADRSRMFIRSYSGAVPCCAESVLISSDLFYKLTSWGPSRNASPNHASFTTPGGWRHYTHANQSILW